MPPTARVMGLPGFDDVVPNVCGREHTTPHSKEMNQNPTTGTYSNINDKVVRNDD